MKRYGIWGAVLATTLTVAACDDDAEVVAPATDQMFEVRVENVSTVFDFTATGVFNTPAGAAGPGPLLPGGVYEATFDAGPGTRLSFATMFVQSNDFFFAPDGAGIALWDDAGNQMTGDVTDQVLLWDAGTEADEEPGLGMNQAPRQSGPDTGGDDPNATVRRADDAYANLPAVTDVVRVWLDSTGPTSFRLRIENVSDAMTLTTSDGMMHPVPLAPGVWVVHTAADPLFTEGEADRGQGLEAVAEDGGTGDLHMALSSRTGVTSPIAPGVFAVHRDPSPLFMAGMVDAGLGLEALAEDGDPTGLAAALSGNAAITMSGAFNTPEGAGGPAPAFPGEAYVFEVTAEPGDRLSFATMFVQSNDLFFAPSEAGLDLFPNGSALNGDVTGMILLWDAGTEANELPGVGLNQAPRQSGADTGADENGAVGQVNDGYLYPSVGDVIRVTVRPIG